MWLATEGGGAEGPAGYLAHTAKDSDEFYNESTPTWWIPGRYYDLRDTWSTFYLKEIEPITVAARKGPEEPRGRLGSARRGWECRRRRRRRREWDRRRR